MEEREMAGVVLDLRHGIVVLLFCGHELPSIRHRVLLRIWMANFQEISWGGIACFKEKTSLQATAPTVRSMHNPHSSPRLLDHRSADLETLRDYHDQSSMFLLCAHLNSVENRAVDEGSETVTRTPHT